MKINNQNNYKPNFTSVIPVKVFGRVQRQGSEKIMQAVQKENVSNAICELATAITGQPKTIGNLRYDIISEFIKNVPDYTIPQKGFKKGEIIRHAFVDGVGYLFTGKEAELIDSLGKKLGPAKRFGKETANTVNTLEVHQLRAQYFQSILNIIYKPGLRLKKVFDGIKSRPVELHINSNCSLKKNSKGELKYKFDIENVSFEEKGTSCKMKVNSTPNSSYREPVSPMHKPIIFRKKSKNVPTQMELNLGAKT